MELAAGFPVTIRVVLEESMQPDDNDLDEFLIGRARQHDCELFEHETPEGQLVYSWRWQRQEPGPQFLSRQLALAWMAEWLEEDTASQGLSRSALSEQRDPNS